MHVHLQTYTHMEAYTLCSMCSLGSCSELEPACFGLQESWYEKLNRWDEALEAYNRKYQETPMGSAANLEAALGRLRLPFCLFVPLSLPVCLYVCISFVCLPACLPA